MKDFIQKCRTNPENLKQIGKGINKRCYRYSNESKFVLLCVSELRKSTLEDEIRQLKELKRKGIIVPEISDIESFDMKKEKYAAVEEYIDGLEVNKKGGVAFDESDVKDFALAICNFIVSKSDKELAIELRSNAIDSINKLQYVYNNDENFDIPDLQFRFNYNDGFIYVIDPGYSKDNGINRSKHIKWINCISTILKDIRYWRQEWDKKHPDNKGFNAK